MLKYSMWIWQREQHKLFKGGIWYDRRQGCLTSTDLILQTFIEHLLCSRDYDYR